MGKRKALAPGPAQSDMSMQEAWERAMVLMEVGLEAYPLPPDSLEDEIDYSRYRKAKDYIKALAIGSHNYKEDK